MTFFDKLAKGFAAVQATVGSDELSEKMPLTLEGGGKLTLQIRRRREDQKRFIRVETPLGEGLARIDLLPSDARALSEALVSFANTAADEAKPIEATPEPPKD